MTNLRCRGMTLVEVLVALVLTIPITYVVWSSHVTGRQAEVGTLARAGAMRGACTLGAYLRRDVERVDLTSDTPPFDVTSDSLTLRVMTRGSGAGVTVESIAYKLIVYGQDPSVGAYSVTRNGRPLEGVVVKGFAVELPYAPMNRWLAIDFAALDTELRRDKQGDLYEHSTSILCPLPWTPTVGRFIDYSKPLPPRPAAEGWIEAMTGRLVWLGSYNADNPGVFPQFYLDIDGTEVPLAHHLSDGTNRVEMAGSAPYQKMATTPRIKAGKFAPKTPMLTRANTG